MSDLTTSRSYLDFGSLAALRGQAAQDERKALRQTAEQFESYFIQETLKAMRQTIEKSELNESDSTGMYEDLMDKEIAQQMARRGGMGVADMLERQLAQRMEQALPSTQEALKARSFELNPAPAALPVATPPRPPLTMPRAAGDYALPLSPAMTLPRNRN